MLSHVLRDTTSVWLVLLSILVLSPVSGQKESVGNVRNSNQDSRLTRYILQRLLGTDSGGGGSRPLLRQRDRAAAEAKIFNEGKGGGGGGGGGAARIVYPQYRSGSAAPASARVDDLDLLDEYSIRRYLDEAKEQLDVIDFRRSSEPTIRQERNGDFADGDLNFSDSASASEQVPVKLAFPGNTFGSGGVSSGGGGGGGEKRPPRQVSTGCTNCVSGGSAGSGTSRWTMPLQQVGKKQYYLGIFFKANWYKAEQYCRFHGMHLCSIDNADEQKDLQEHIQAVGMGHEHFWTSGTDQGEEGKFFWMSTGRPITYSNYNAGEPNNFEYEDGEQEHCLEMWDRDGKGLGWNDTPCSFQTFFICEA